MTSKAIDIAKIEALRQALLLSATEMAMLLGVSRITYYNWRNGAGISQNSAYAARGTIKKLAGIYMAGLWPLPDSHKLTSKKRFSCLLALMEEPKEDVPQPQDGAPA